MTKLHTTGTRFRAEPIRSAAIRISSLCAAILLFASCPGSLIDSGGGSSGAGETGSLSIRLTDAASGDALFSARALVPGVLSQMKAVSISVTDSAGITHEYSASSADLPSAGAQIEDVYPGKAEVSAFVYADAEKTSLLASGTVSATVVKGQAASVQVPLILADAGTGNGSLDLNIAFPVDKDIDSITAGFIGTDGSIDSSYPAVWVGSADYSEGTATLHASEIPAGACTLSVSFLRRGTQIGRIIEAVNIRSGAAANRWIDQNGTLQETRTYSADELGVSAAGLASLSAGGVQVPLSSGTLEYSITLGDSDSISFILSGAIAGQSYRWKWAPEAGMAVEGSASPLVASPALATSGSNLLTITVTAPDGETTQTYVVRVIRSWEVSFNVSGGSYIEPLIVANGGTVERPADPEYSGFAFSGWYADSSLSTPWTFGSGGRTVTGDAALYAKWVESASIIAVTISAPEFQHISFRQFGNEVSSITMDIDATLELSMPEGGARYEWLLNARDWLSSDRTLIFSPRLNGAGRKTITAVFEYDGVVYSGDLSVLVTNDYMVEILPYGKNASYAQVSWTYDSDLYQSAPSSYDHTLTRPYSLGKYEVSYSLWKPVRDWALANGYVIGNEGAAGGSGSAGVDYPVTQVSYFDALVWCNAYSEMSGLTPCYYTSTTDKTDASVLRSTSYLKALAESGILYTAAYADLAADGYRLPSEGEWHFAASCGGYYPFNSVSGGSAVFSAGNSATYSDWANSKTGVITPCGSLAPNIWGLYDMSGNMWEACFDVCNNPPDGPFNDYIGTTYSGTVSSSYAIIVKGGSFASLPPAGKSTIGHRDASAATTAASDSGFRLARTIVK
ncbi:SUMF1/EgtB/PvdO family nonheme iron enzyme [Treponema zuelzerae]|uniref:SUMF1/EgtB/PvdO family nonheme iron enzyme n=1 Tax=Teretinema zuelzerae TaxID=156 RepID=A0AAE3EEW8_9SPIR|nr:SUMF1/EgtB/PvdO family nonheme iron enzyme [Teretinema zuelzerae]MCD1653405.1 SUMF1/EgtB/PvdO family nonheme iron enzyme [Teretinema zuelzerae]